MIGLDTAVGAGRTDLLPRIARAERTSDGRAVAVRFADAIDPALVARIGWGISSDGVSWSGATARIAAPGAAEARELLVLMPYRLDSATQYRIAIYTAGQEEQWPV